MSNVCGGDCLLHPGSAPRTGQRNWSAASGASHLGEEEDAGDLFHTTRSGRRSGEQSIPAWLEQFWQVCERSLTHVVDQLEQCRVSSNDNKDCLLMRVAALKLRMSSFLKPSGHWRAGLAEGAANGQIGQMIPLGVSLGAQNRAWARRGRTRCARDDVVRPDRPGLVPHLRERCDHAGQGPWAELVAQLRAAAARRRRRRDRPGRGQLRGCASANGLTGIGCVALASSRAAGKPLRGAQVTRLSMALMLR